MNVMLDEEYRNKRDRMQDLIYKQERITSQLQILESHFAEGASLYDTRVYSDFLFEATIELEKTNKELRKIMQYFYHGEVKQ